MSPHRRAALTTATPWARSNAIEAQIGGSIARVVADAGYRGHNAPDGYRLKVYTLGSSAVEPVIGHLKGEHRMDRNPPSG